MHPKTLPPGKKIYFASDFHLGVDGKYPNQVREKVICEWLEHISEDAHALYLVGDLFDFWFEYKKVVPKGHIRFLGKLAEIADKRISIFIFTGNHDMWMYEYLEDELGANIYKQPVIHQWNEKKFFIGHGDGLGPGDKGYKRLKRLFRNNISQKLFQWLHPDLGVKIARYFSDQSRFADEETPSANLEDEWLVKFIREHMIKEPGVDYYIFGHRHLPIDYNLSDSKVKYINLGDWVRYYTYALYNGKDLTLTSFNKYGPTELDILG